MMPPADRIYDPGQGAKKDLTDTGDDFLAIGPALRIMQLNVEGLSKLAYANNNYYLCFSGSFFYNFRNPVPECKTTLDFTVYTSRDGGSNNNGNLEA